MAFQPAPPAGRRIAREFVRGERPVAEHAWQGRLAENVARVRATIAAACGRAGRDPSAVCLVAVTKYAAPGVLQALPALGVPDLGENQVQQLVARARQCGPARCDWPSATALEQGHAGGAAGADAIPLAPRWHMIGHLQRNKVRLLLPHARILHGLDSERLAHAVQQHARQLAVTVDAFIEVNIAGQASKFGVPPGAVETLAQVVASCPHIRLRGLMAMAPFDPDPERSRPHFASLRGLLDRLRQSGAGGPLCAHLSLGMSADYVVAVEEGATLVRVGSALFEGLPTADPRGP
jgi:pyridoxal phosphate enzyme (YggS family)